MHTIYTTMYTGESPITQPTLLEALVEARVMEVYKLHDGRVGFREACDDVYDAILTPEQVRELARELCEFVSENDVKSS